MSRFTSPVRSAPAAAIGATLLATQAPAMQLSPATQSVWVERSRQLSVSDWPQTTTRSPLQSRLPEARHSSVQVALQKPVLQLVPVGQGSVGENSRQLSPSKLPQSRTPAPSHSPSPPVAHSSVQASTQAPASQRAPAAHAGSASQAAQPSTSVTQRSTSSAPLQRVWPASQAGVQPVSEVSPEPASAVSAGSVSDASAPEPASASVAPLSSGPASPPLPSVEVSSGEPVSFPPPEPPRPPRAGASEQAATAVRQTTSSDNEQRRENMVPRRARKPATHLPAFL